MIYGVEHAFLSTFRVNLALGRGTCFGSGVPYFFAMRSSDSSLYSLSTQQIKLTYKSGVFAGVTEIKTSIRDQLRERQK